jgi:hypothetical protein
MRQKLRAAISLADGVRIEDGKEIIQSLIIDSDLDEIRRVDLSVEG